MSLALQSLLPYPNSCEGASPHQQGRDTKMLSFCGIDVSKDRLDVMVLPDEYSSSVPNDPAGWAILVEQLRGWRNRRVEGSSRRDGVARRVLLFGAERPSRLGDIGRAAARLLDHSDRHRSY